MTLFSLGLRGLVKVADRVFAAFTQAPLALARVAGSPVNLRFIGFFIVTIGLGLEFAASQVTFLFVVNLGTASGGPAKVTILALRTPTITELAALRASTWPHAAIWSAFVCGEFWAVAHG